MHLLDRAKHNIQGGQMPRLTHLRPLDPLKIFRLRHRKHFQQPFRTYFAWPYLYSKKTMAPQLDAYFKQVDAFSDRFIDRLRKAVAIPSVSADDERRPDVVKVCPTPLHNTADRPDGRVSRH
jgi:hypothetical protein